MVKTVKCQLCGVSDTPKEEMVQYLKKNFHTYCVDEFKQKQYQRSLRECFHCGIKDTPADEMVLEVIKTEKTETKRYIHLGCHSAYLEEQEARKKDNDEKDILNETMCDIFGVQNIGASFWSKLTNLRNGRGYGFKPTERKTKGYTYAQINQAFLNREGDIASVRNYKRFENDMQYFSYSLAIVVSELSEMEQIEAFDSQAEAVADLQMGDIVTPVFDKEYATNALDKYKKNIKKKKVPRFF